MRYLTMIRSKKALFTAAIALAVMLPSVAVAYTPGERFTDDNGNTHEAAIEAIADEGITKGCNPPANTKYCPDSPLLREEVAAFIDRSFGLPNTSQDFFNDDSDSQFESSINRMAAAGITKGCAPGRYCDTRTITRAEIAAFLANAMDLKPTNKDYFNDDNGHTQEANINALAAAGITKGCNPPANNQFCPNERLKRDEFASLLARALDLDLKAIVSTTPPPPSSPPAEGGNVIWRGDAETGNTKQWKSVSISGKAGVDVVTSPVHSGNYALKLSNYDVDGSHNAGVRLNLQGPFGPDPRNLPDDGYYSAWYYIPFVFEGHSNIFQYKQSDATSYRNGEPASHTRRMLWKVGLYYDGSDYDLEIRSRINQDTGLWSSKSIQLGMVDVDIPIGEWFHIETRYKWGQYGSGRTTVWLNGQKVWDRAASTWAPNLDCYQNCREFVISHYLSDYQGYVAPGDSWIFIDDAKLATGRQGP